MFKSTFRKIVTLSAMMLPLAFVGQAANAAAVTTNGVSTYNFLWSHDTGAGVIITGTGSITANTTSATNLQLAVTLTNTTALPVGDNMALLSFGFGIDPNATAVGFSDDADGMINDATMVGQQGSTNIPSLTNIEVCAFGGNNCSGGSVNDGIQAGGTDSFFLNLTGAGAWASAVTIAPIGFKFQGTVGSFEFYSGSSSGGGSTSSGGGSTGGQVPEPGTLTLLGLGLLGLGFGRRLAKSK